MISARLNGGLGNQLFQVATAVALAIENNDDYAFDFNREVVMQGNKGSTYKHNVYLWLHELPDTWKPKAFFKEMTINYKEIPYQPNMLLEGYFQSDKYFQRQADVIRGLFMHTKTINKLKQRYGKILPNSVSVHVRRGDYVPLKETLDENYYYIALNTLWELTNIEHVLVFSDDIGWCKSNFLTEDKRVYYVEGNEDYEDLYLMSLCSHNITANSSFSWWGAYLNRNKDVRVIMPLPWTSSHDKDIYMENAIVINR